uniref:J domain-containing protein n=1 Tax=Timema shepardi TaxID=629360 RepID=A0A7R9B1R0_TIMSH|nr:unnamed protein product [Timema shepardi]
MSELLDLCRKYFGSRDLYEVLQISKSSDSKQVKKAYHKVSLLVHPDRVDENEKIEATEKFKVLGKVHSILNDKDKRKQSSYNTTSALTNYATEASLMPINKYVKSPWGYNLRCINCSTFYNFSGDDETADRDWNLYWDIIYKNITVEDISNYEKKYKGQNEERTNPPVIVTELDGPVCVSELKAKVSYKFIASSGSHYSDEELQDLKRAYLGGKGDMDLILELVPFTNTEEEPRLKKLIQGLIDRGEVPAFPAFTHESAQKKANRKRKVCINYWPCSNRDCQHQVTIDSVATETANNQVTIDSVANGTANIMNGNEKLEKLEKLEKESSSKVEAGWEREAGEAAALEKERGYMGGTDDDLKKLLLKKQEQRSKEYDSFFEALASKYGSKDTKRRSNPKRNKKQ